jgi:hypothetical protein
MTTPSYSLGIVRSPHRSPPPPSSSLLTAKITQRSGLRVRWDRVPIGEAQLHQPHQHHGRDHPDVHQVPQGRRADEVVRRVVREYDDLPQAVPERYRRRVRQRREMLGRQPVRVDREGHQQALVRQVVQAPGGALPQALSRGDRRRVRTRRGRCHPDEVLQHGGQRDGRVQGGGGGDTGARRPGQPVVRQQLEQRPGNLREEVPGGDRRGVRRERSGVLRPHRERPHMRDGERPREGGGRSAEAVLRIYLQCHDEVGKGDGYAYIHPCFRHPLGGLVVHT